MAMNLVIILATLVQKRELKERPDIGALARQRDEERYVGGVILAALAVGVEVNGPGVAADGEGIGREELSDPHAFR